MVFASLNPPTWPNPHSTFLPQKWMVTHQTIGRPMKIKELGFLLIQKYFFAYPKEFLYHTNQPKFYFSFTSD